MAYTTIYETSERTKIFLVRSVFDQYGIEYRILDEHSDPNFAKGTRIQVRDNQQERAYAVLKENGLTGMKESSEPKKEPDSRKSFWTFFIVAILAVILVSILINRIFG